MPHTAAYSARSTAGSGLHFTAYRTSPGNACTKSCAVSATTAGRRQWIGSSGRSAATTSSTVGQANRLATNGRRSGETAERVRATKTSRHILANRRTRANASRSTKTGTKRDLPERAKASETGSNDAGGTSHRGGAFEHRRVPKRPRPTVWPGLSKRTRLRRCCAPDISAHRTRGTCDASPPLRDQEARSAI